MKPLVEAGPTLTPQELARYDRQLQMPQLGQLGQRRLKSARVLVVGAGGLGSPVLLYLAAAGVGTIGLVDFDAVEESNLHRQVIHPESSLGRSKVDSALRRVAETNPLIRTRPHSGPITAANATEMIKEYDLVVDGTDNFATRYLINDACAFAAKPFVWASIFRFDGQVSVFWAGRGPCYRCIYPDPPEPDQVPSCAEAGVLGVLPGVIGSVQATEAIKLITGAGEPLVGRLLIHDSLNQDWQSLRIAPDPDCPVCGDRPSITELIDYDAFCGTPPLTEGISADRLAELLAQRASGAVDFSLIDIREPAEAELGVIDGSLLVPKGEIESGRVRLPEGRLVLYCRSGYRSGQVRRLLRDRGREVEQLRGGIDAWRASQSR